MVEEHHEHQSGTAHLWCDVEIADRRCDFRIVEVLRE